MSMPHPSERLPDDKRAALFSRAVEEFSAQGFENASLNRIIAAVGMSKSSFYNVFANKEDLFARALDHMLRPYIEVYEGFDFDALTAQTYWPAIRDMVLRQTADAAQQPELRAISSLMLNATDSPIDGTVFEDLMQFSQRWLATMMTRGQELGLVRRDLPQELLLGQVMGLAMAMDRWILSQWDSLSPEDRLHWADVALDSIIRLVRPAA